MKQASRYLRRRMFQVKQIAREHTLPGGCAGMFGVQQEQLEGKLEDEVKKDTWLEFMSPH